MKETFTLTIEDDIMNDSQMICINGFQVDADLDEAIKKFIACNWQELGGE